MNSVAIDFGTERTKLSYWDERRGEPRLMRLGLDERPYLPSLFYLGADGTKLLGADAQEMLEEDPGGIVDVLKRRLRDSSIRRNRQKVTPSELLSMLLRNLRERAGAELVHGAGSTVDTAVLTVPARYGPADNQITRSAALDAGFTNVELVPEPVAAARAWLHEVGGEDQNVVVFDCGGGTIDWAFLRRVEGDFQLDPDCPPGGDEKVGGHDIDEELFLLVKECLEDNELHDALSALVGARPKYVAAIRQLKERFHRRGGAQTLRIGKQKIELTPEHISEAANTRFIEQAWQGLEAYLMKVQSALAGEKSKILLVGGSARLQGLRETIDERSGSDVVWWERSEYATALGAVRPPEGGTLSERNGETPGEQPKPHPVQHADSASVETVPVPVHGVAGESELRAATIRISSSRKSINSNTRRVGDFDKYRADSRSLIGAQYWHADWDGHLIQVVNSWFGGEALFFDGECLFKSKAFSSAGQVIGLGYQIHGNCVSGGKMHRIRVKFGQALVGATCKIYVDDYEIPVNDGVRP